MARVLLLDADSTADVFELVELSEDLARVRTAFLFEVGEEMRLRLEDGATTSEATARVRAHVGPADDRITELEILERTPR